MTRAVRAGSAVSGVRCIGLLRANALGDFIFALPAIASLRAAYPDAELVLLGRPWHVSFLEGRGVVDRVLAVPVGPSDAAAPWIDADPPELEHFVTAAAAERFDVLLQLHGGGRESNPLVAAIGARVTAGLRTPDAAPLDRWVPYVYYQPEPLRLLEVVGLVGAPPVDLDPRLPVTDADRLALRQDLRGADPPEVVLHPGAMDARRRWPPERFAAVGDALAAGGRRVAVTGSSAESDLTAAVVARMRAPAVDLGGRTSLGGLTAILERATLLVSNDSGPVHLAGAVGTPSVGIYWAGNLINGGPLTRTRHRPLVSWTNACPVCGRTVAEPRCDHDESFVADVSVEDVLAEAEALLNHVPC